ncbi:hypothetical protein [Mangrovicoccus ximenensis]|uniref:hypothetical protein n=1 Tax=Mangrovicoccus ximenensis TaxID=1911570 RepID=UPI001F467367|nr:hypothetical protein [Mangrovicoccus ximenensis]
MPVRALPAAALAAQRIRHPGRIAALARHVGSVKIGQMEMKLRQVETELRETGRQLSEAKTENARLAVLYTRFDPHAPVPKLQTTRQALAETARTLGDFSPAPEGLQPGTSAEDAHAAAAMRRVGATRPASAR